MSTVAIALLLCVAIVLAIVIGTLKKVNIGVLGMVFAYIIGCLILKLSPMELIAMFPLKILFITMSTTLFFGFAVENGTVNALADHILFRSKNHPWAIPIVLTVAAMILGMIGADTTSVVVALAPMGFVLSKKINFHPLLVVIGVGAFAAVGSGMPWSAVGSLCRGIVSQSFAPEEAFSMVNASAWALAIIYAIVFVVAYFVLKGYKADKVEMEKPEPFTAIQRKNLVIIGIVLAVVIIPLIINSIAANPVTMWMKTNFDMQLVAIVGAGACALLKLADERTVITKRVPWGLIIMVGGISMIIGLMQATGVIDMISQVISDNVGSSAIQPVIVTIGSILSFVTSGVTGALIPFTPMLSGISAASGVSATSLYACLGASVVLTSLSPFSMGGAFILGFADQSEQKKLMVQQLVLAIIVAVLGILLAFTGFYTIFG